MAMDRRAPRKDDDSSKPGDLVNRLSAHFSQDEIQKVFGRSLLALDTAGMERMIAGLETETAAAVRKLLKTGTRRKQAKMTRPTSAKIRQEWDAAWRDWDACISETCDEGGKYVFQEHHWEPPYLDRSALAEDLEPIAARILAILPQVFERRIAPEFSFAQALQDTAEEIGGNSECIDDSGEALAFGPTVTRCLLEWEWQRARRDSMTPFEFLDIICALEQSAGELYLDHPTIDKFISGLESGIKREMLNGIVEHRQSGHWARALRQAHGGWFGLYKKLCQKWDPGLFLETCRNSVSRDWKLALPVIDDLMARKAFQDAVMVAEEAARSMLRLNEGEPWDPRSGLILKETTFPYDGERDAAIRALLNRWRKAARAIGDCEAACALDLQVAVLRDCRDGDAIMQALRNVSPRFRAIAERIFEDWKSLIAVWSVEPALDECTEPEHAWVKGLVDAIRAGNKGPARFRRVVLGWLKETGKTRASLKRGFKSLAVLTCDLDSGLGLKRESPTLMCLLLRECAGDQRVTALRRMWLKRLRAGELTPAIIRFWKRHATGFVPDPEHSGGDYQDCADWLVALRDFDAPGCAKIIRQWQAAHRRRKNLWKALQRAKLVSG